MQTRYYARVRLKQGFVSAKRKSLLHAVLGEQSVDAVCIGNADQYIDVTRFISARYKFMRFGLRPARVDGKFVALHARKRLFKKFCLKVREQ
jgi:hypothetical protein